MLSDRAISAAEPGGASITARVGALNDRYRHQSATALLAHALADPETGRVAMVSSFGADSVVLLHMLSILAPATPVLFIDTEMLFAETLDYQRRVAHALRLRDVRTIRPATPDVAARDPEGALHRGDPDACCDLRKTRPLVRALAPYDAWITGRKRFQGGRRAELPLFEPDGADRRQDQPAGALGARGSARVHCRKRPAAAPAGGPRLPFGRLRAVHHARRRRRGSARRALARQRQDRMRHPFCRRPRRARRASGDEGGFVMTDTATASGPDDDAPAVLVRDDGFHAEDWQAGFTALADRDAAGTGAVDVAPGDDVATLADGLDRIAMIRIAFASFADGRGFTLARRLRAMGYVGRLRAAGHVIADQYAMARRAGFDEVEIPAALARRQPAAQWQARADWRARDYQSRLRGG